MYLVDTHQHFWDPAQFSYSWCKSVPPLNRRFGLDDYKQAAEGLNIRKTVFMECDVDEPHALEEARHVQRLTATHTFIAGIVASARPESSSFPAQLEALLALSRLRGLRRVLHTQPDALADSTLFAENLQRLSQHRLSFDLCVLARQLPVAVRLVERCSDVSFVLDHCGIPDVKAGALDPWREQMTRLAEFPNVVCKISGLVAYADPERWTVDDLRPWVEHVVDRFGWERVLWGGDWPVCTLTASLARWVEATHELFRGATLAQRSAFFHRNAERIYRV